MANKGILRMIRDNDSSTGLSAAILLRNVRPKKMKDGKIVIATGDFIANFPLNCEGYRVRPRVTATVECHLHPVQIDSIKKKKAFDRAMAGSPILK